MVDRQRTIGVPAPPLLESGVATPGWFEEKFKDGSQALQLSPGEGGELMGVARAQGYERLAPALCTLYDGDGILSSTISRGAGNCRHACIGITTTLQPSMVKKMAGIVASGEQSLGQIERFLLVAHVYSLDRDELCEAVPASISSAVDALFRRAHDCDPSEAFDAFEMPGAPDSGLFRVPLTEDAARVIADYQKRLKFTSRAMGGVSSSSEHLASRIGKLPGLVLRLAFWFHAESVLTGNRDGTGSACRGQGPICVHCISRGIALAEKLHVHSCSLLKLGEPGHSEARDLLDLARSKGAEHMHARTLSQLSKAASKPTLSSVPALLTGARYLESMHLAAVEEMRANSYRVWFHPDVFSVTV